MKKNLSFFLSLMGLLLLSSSLKAILLKNTSLKTLQGNKIGYYNGSFDPFHNGHKKAIDAALEKGLDYIFVYAIPGKSKRKPNRIDHKYRNQMLLKLYKNHPKVIVSDLNGYQIQNTLKKLKQTTFIGIVGAEVIDEFKGHEEWERIYLYGTPLNPDEGYSSKAAMMLVSVDQFYVLPRSGFKIPKTLLGKRKITPINTPEFDISSTEIRKRVKEGGNIEDLVPLKVGRIIKKRGLYHSK